MLVCRYEACIEHKTFAVDIVDCCQFVVCVLSVPETT